MSADFAAGMTGTPAKRAKLADKERTTDAVKEINETLMTCR